LQRYCKTNIQFREPGDAAGMKLSFGEETFSGCIHNCRETEQIHIRTYERNVMLNNGLSVILIDRVLSENMK